MSTLNCVHLITISMVVNPKNVCAGCGCYTKIRSNIAEI